MHQQIRIFSVGLTGLVAGIPVFAPAEDAPVANLVKPRGNQIGAEDPDSIPLETLQGNALTELVSRLGRIKPGPEQTRAVAQLSQGGDTTTDEIERQSAQLASDFGWVHTSVRVLEKINTSKSRTMLRKIALGEIKVENPNLQGWASRALITCDPKEARGLLTSSSAEVLEAAINSLRGNGLDQDLMNALKTHIQSKNLHIRSIAAGIMASEAPQGELADQALQSIKEALTSVADIPNPDAIDPSSGRVNYQMTAAEAEYQRYLSMLPQLKVENPALREMAESLKGRARATVMLGLAFRKDATVHDEIIKLAQNEEGDMFRAWAAAALGEIGTVDDIPLLQRLAEKDPLKRGGGGDVFPRGNSGFPVRERALQSIKTIERAAK